MLEIKNSGRSLKYKVKKSRFICSIYKIKAKKEAEFYLKKNNEEFKKATHNAFAYRIGNPIEWEESSDDGEVKGCAGLPLMNLLRNLNLTNILVIVTRYYGGIKLGPANLIKHYSKCAADLIEIIGTKKLN